MLRNYTSPFFFFLQQAPAIVFPCLALAKTARSYPSLCGEQVSIVDSVATRANKGAGSQSWHGMQADAAAFRDLNASNAGKTSPLGDFAVAVM